MGDARPQGRARTLPDDLARTFVVGPACRFAADLPDAYTVYHGVHWTRVNHGHALVGEIDFAIVNPAGDLLLIEQKSGYLSETPEGLAKHYEKKEKLVPVQMARSAEALRKRLNAQGSNLQEMVAQTRFELAKQLLQSTRLSVAEIAAVLHYSDANVFSRAFRNWAGASPRAWLAQVAYR